MSVTPLAAAIDWYKQRKIVLAVLAEWLTHRCLNDDELNLLRRKTHKLFADSNAIDLKYPIKGGVIVKEQRDEA